MGRANEEAAAGECGDRGAGQQDGADDLGGTGPRPAIPERIREREAGLNGERQVKD